MLVNNTWRERDRKCILQCGITFQLCPPPKIQVHCVAISIAAWWMYYPQVCWFNNIQYLIGRQFQTNGTRSNKRWEFLLQIVMNEEGTSKLEVWIICSFIYHLIIPSCGHLFGMCREPSICICAWIKVEIGVHKEN